MVVVNRLVENVVNSLIIKRYILYFFWINYISVFLRMGGFDLIILIMVWIIFYILKFNFIMIKIVYNMFVNKKKIVYILFLEIINIY